LNFFLKWELKVEKGDNDFHQISKTIKEEVKRFDLERVREFKIKMTNYLEGLLASQEQVIRRFLMMYNWFC